MHPFLRGTSREIASEGTTSPRLMKTPSSGGGSSVDQSRSDVKPETMIADQMCLLNGIDPNSASGRKIQQHIVDQIRSGQPIDIHKAMHL
jgi:hypothetical protein